MIRPHFFNKSPGHFFTCRHVKPPETNIRKPYPDTHIRKPRPQEVHAMIIVAIGIAAVAIGGYYTMDRLDKYLNKKESR